MIDKHQQSMSTVHEPAQSGCECCATPNKPVVPDTPKTGRNDPCICSNGRKLKKCCGKNT
ncbi:SEC-C metal-binding domain-containing protein [Marinomonas pollencensis]|uniref:SEC-C metal-binding domain-containing protein n=1 Tax=Marinomonas pollencensis TaxID=491954 RepID=UPI000E284E34|nr:SEC-C metal-binding domain-containing protein [Marinomonas pollencensis]